MKTLLILLASIPILAVTACAQEIHHYAAVNGVKLHYVEMGKGKTILFLHGFPEFWYAWKEQVRELSKHYHTVAVDMRGYNLSDKPEKVEDYAVPKIVEDIKQLLDHVNAANPKGKTVLVGHDWGGAIAWVFAAMHPDYLDRLIIINGPHPTVFSRELKENPAQQRASGYMNLFKSANAEKTLSANDYALLKAAVFGGPKIHFSEAEKAEYVRAWSQPRALTGGLNYYRASGIGPPVEGKPAASLPALPVIKVPTLVIWGMKDTALLPGNLEGLDRVVDHLTIKRIPEGSHWVVHEEPELINRSIMDFLQDNSVSEKGAVAQTGRAFEYPAARKSDQVDVLHGVTVADPYRWLENTDSPETRDWIEAENKLTAGYLQSLPGRERIQKRLTQMLDFERIDIPSKVGKYYVFGRNSGLQNQSIIYVTDSLSKEPRVLLDPNTLSKDGTVALGGLSFTHDGKLVAYAIATAGSDWNEWKVRDVETGKDLADHIQWSKFSSASWTRDGKGFLYGRYDEPKAGQSMLQVRNVDRKIYYHRLGTPQSEDVLVFNDPAKTEWFPNGQITEDGKYLIITTSPPGVNKNAVYYAPVGTLLAASPGGRDATRGPKDAASSVPTALFKPLFDKLDAQYGFINNDGPVFWFTTDRDAPRHKVVAVDIRHPESWKEIVPQSAESLNSAHVLNNDRFVVSYLKDAHTVVRTFGLDGKPMGEIALPGIGSAGGFGGEKKNKETFYSFTGFTTPSTIFHYDVPTGKSALFKRPQVAFDPDTYETKQIFYKSKDGTRVPMFITHKKGIKLDGSNPTLLYGYGGFNVSETPAFSASRVVWMEMGGVYCVATLRGGGEYGEEWHQAGTKLKKQNVFDDFIAAGEWLIANGYTNPKKLAIQGGSNGGLLVGAVLNQRPDLFGAALPAVGVMDMLRFHKFTIGANWIRDYGSPDDATEFAAIYKYSPIHNIHPGTKYPPTLITTSDHDDRVVPAHSFKYAATIQAAQAGDAPTLIRIETKAGHGAGKPISKQIEETADIYAFLVKSLGMEIPSSFGR